MTAYRDVPVLVFGASGFIGGWVVRALAARGAVVHAVVRDDTTEAAARVRDSAHTVIKTDLSVSGAIRHVIDDVSPSVVFNLAGYGVDRNERDPAAMDAVNAALVAELCACMAAQPEREWGGCRVVHVGSAPEYGDVVGKIREDLPPSPGTDYGRSKLAGTQHVARWGATHGLRAIVARLFQVYGPGEHAGRLLPSLERAAGSGERVALTSGEQRRDFTYVEDVADGLLRLAVSGARPGEVINLATGRLTTVREFVEIAASVLGVDRAALDFGAMPMRAGEMYHEEVDVTRLRALTSWVPETSIAAGVRRSVGARPASPLRSVTHRSTCRVCGGDDLTQVLSLGPMPLANAFLRSPAEFDAEQRYPLDLYFCRGCTLLQLLDVVDPDVLFRHYLYVSGTSATMAEHRRAYAESLIGLVRRARRVSARQSSADLVVEIASNDGSLLRELARHGVVTLGIEPARNLAEQANAAGIETLTEFFTHDLAVTLRRTRGPAAVVVANNVLAHVDDPVDLLRGCRELVADDGMVVVEVPYVRELVERLEYDTVYHEHLSYFSVTSLLRLCERAGLVAVQIDRLPVHGGSLRLYLSRAGEHHAAAVLALAKDEQTAGLAGEERYRAFADGVEAGRLALRRLLERLVLDGKRVVGYGAPAKGNTLLNYCSVDTTLVPFTVDRNPLKVGMYTPGTHLPVRDVAALSSTTAPPDYLLILPWNLADEIMAQQQAHRARGGRFIIPVPAPQVIE